MKFLMLYQIGTIELWEFKGNDLALKHADGTLTVSKFMHAVSRGTNDVIRLDGVVQRRDKQMRSMSMFDSKERFPLCTR